MLNLRWSLLCVLTVLPTRAAVADNAFDPSGYIDHKETQKSAHAATLVSQGIMRIDGKRFAKLTSPEGSVYLPSPGAVPEIREELMLCQQHLRLMNEVLLVRDSMPVEADLKRHEEQVIGLIRRCVEGRFSGPIIVDKMPDEVAQPKPKEKPKTGPDRTNSDMMK